MEWLSDPNIWIGLSTLIILEIVLGIDNLVFIAILADKLPPHQRAKARYLGLGLALLMRILLLFSISWVVTLTQPLFAIGGLDFSGRDLILIVGGLFLLAKGTMELHERLEGAHKPKQGKVVHAVFWQVIVQIIVLDAVFSLDSVITAVGMVDELPVMIAAVCVAMLVMVLAARPLTNFVSKHPTVVILCLGFLMMIGFSLVVEGFGFHIPKGYLYAAIGFSVLIEAANQLSRRNKERLVTTHDLRARASDTVLRLLGGRASHGALSETVDAIAERTADAEVFKPEEQEMIRGVLSLGERPVSSIMSTRSEIEWIDLNDATDDLRQTLRGLTHSRVILARGQIENFVGVAVTRDLLNCLLDDAPVAWPDVLRQPVVVHEGATVLSVIEQLRVSPVQLAIVLNEHGDFEGVVTPTDVLEAIAGEFPDLDEAASVSEQLEDGAWLIDGFMDIRQASSVLETDLTDPGDRYTTLAGFFLNRFGAFPIAGDAVEHADLRFEILEVDRHVIRKVRISPLPSAR